MNAPESPSEHRRALSRWEEVIYPSYRIIPVSERPVRTKPRWLEREQGKDLTGQIRGDTSD